MRTSAGKAGPLLDEGVWPLAQRALPRFKAVTFFLLVLVPAALTVCFCIVLVHDILWPQQPQFCWEEDALAMHWAGAFVHWLSMDRHGRHYFCGAVPRPEGLPIYFVVLVPTWIAIVSSSWKTRRLRRDRGIIRSLLEKVYRAVGAGESEAPEGYLGQVPRNSQTQAFLSALEKDGCSAKFRHVRYALLFQATMLVFDFAVKHYTLRWIIWYQVLWFSFSTTVVQVRPLVKFCVFLSRTLVDLYIELLRERKGSWLELLQWHRELELDMLALWSKVNLHVVMPSLPFVSLSLVHFLADQDVASGTVVACFLLVVGGMVLVLILQPIAKISSMFNSTLAFKAEPKLTKGQEPIELRKPGSMSIVAVARSLALEPWPRSPEEDQQYATFLEYLQGGKVTLALGVPGYFMAPISSSTVAGLFTTFILKLPLFVSLFLAARQHVHHTHAGLSL